jgi:Protein of unknown function (DUF3313)
MKIAGILLAVLFCAAVQPRVLAASDAPDASAADEGLVSVKIKGLDTVYALPDANLSVYNKVMLDPVEVSFSKSWRPDTPGQRVTTEDKQKIKDGLADLVRQRLSKALNSSGRYTLVDAPADEVLRIKADIRDLYINAPATMSAGRSKSYAMSAGSMRLVAELRDGPTGALIARVIDHKSDPDSSRLQWTTSVSNSAAAQRAVDDWVRILLRQLDAAHGIGK